MIRDLIDWWRESVRDRSILGRASFIVTLVCLIWVICGILYLVYSIAYRVLSNVIGHILFI